jgi:predicted metal-binding membrane protein
MTTLTVPSATSARQPHIAALVSVGALTLIGWAILLMEALQQGGGVDAFLEALCRPVSISNGASAREIATGFGLSVASWSAMSVAMMLPTAVTMVLSYADLAEDRRRAREVIFSPWFIVIGYLSVWIGFSVFAALLQTLAVEAIGRLGLTGPAIGVPAGLLVSLAGLYQFSALKNSCLFVAHDPTPTLSRDWRSSRAGVLGMGVTQGARCLGCCGGLMGVMLVVGAMNLVWMAAFSLLMAIEKIVAKSWIVWGIGVSLMVAGVMISLDAVGLRLVVAFLGR